MIVENGQVRAYTMVNRVLNITMEGSYGYMKKSLRDAGAAMLTARSTVREFDITDMKEVDHPHFGRTHCLIGTDYYGRELQLPVNRVRGFDECDTEEQGRLKGLNWLLKTYKEFASPDMTPEQTAAIDEHFKEFVDKQAALVAAGVELYEPKRASEDEL